MRERKASKEHLVQLFCFTKGEDVSQNGKDSFKITHLPKEKGLGLLPSTCHPVCVQGTTTMVHTNLIKTLWDGGERALNWELEHLDLVQVSPTQLNLHL